MRAGASIACGMIALAIATGAPAAPGLRGQGVAPPSLATGYAAEYVLGIVLVMLALGAFAFAMRRLQGRVGAARGGLRVCASLPLGGKERLIIVEAEGERLLLGAGAGGVRLLRPLSAPDAAAGENRMAGDTWLARTLDKGIAR